MEEVRHRGVPVEADVHETSERMFTDLTELQSQFLIAQDMIAGKDKHGLPPDILLKNEHALGQLGVAINNIEEAHRMAYYHLRDQAEGIRLHDDRMKERGVQIRDLEKQLKEAIATSEKRIEKAVSVLERERDEQFQQQEEKYEALENEMLTERWATRKKEAIHERQLEDKDKEITVLRKARDELRENEQTLKKTAGSLTATNTDLEKEISQWKADNAAAVQELIETRAEADETIDKNRRLQERIDESNTTINTLAKQLDDKLQKPGQCTKCAKTATDFRTKVQDLLEENKRLRQLAGVDSRPASLKSVKSLAYNSTRSGVNGGTNRARSIVTTSSPRRLEDMEKLGNLLNGGQSATSTSVSLRSRRESAPDGSAPPNSGRQQVNSPANPQRNNSRILSWMSNQELNQQVHLLKEELENKEGELKRALARCRQLEGSTSASSTKETRIRELEIEIAEEQQQVNKLKEDLKKAEDNLREAERKAQEAEKRAEEARSNMKEARSSMEEARSDMEEADDKYRENLDLVIKMQEEVRQCRAEKEETEKKLARCESELEAKSKSLEELQVELSEAVRRHHDGVGGSRPPGVLSTRRAKWLKTSADEKEGALVVALEVNARLLETHENAERSGEGEGGDRSERLRELQKVGTQLRALKSALQSEVAGSITDSAAGSPVGSSGANDDSEGSSANNDSEGSGTNNDSEGSGTDNNDNNSEGSGADNNNNSSSEGSGADNNNSGGSGADNNNSGGSGTVNDNDNGGSGSGNGDNEANPSTDGDDKEKTAVTSRSPRVQFSDRDFTHAMQTQLWLVLEELDNQTDNQTDYQTASSPTDAGSEILPPLSPDSSERDIFRYRQLLQTLSSHVRCHPLARLGQQRHVFEELHERRRQKENDSPKMREEADKLREHVTVLKEQEDWGRDIVRLLNGTGFGEGGEFGGNDSDDGDGDGDGESHWYYRFRRPWVDTSGKGGRGMWHGAAAARSGLRLGIPHTGLHVEVPETVEQTLWGIRQWAQGPAMWLAIVLCLGMTAVEARQYAIWRNANETTRGLYMERQQQNVLCLSRPSVEMVRETAEFVWAHLG